jgi:dTDP-4-dehydrorhamnose reductase
MTYPPAPATWLVTGAAGMLGRDVLAALSPDRKVTALTRVELDITDVDAVRSAVAGQDVVVNCAAWTNVDGAESDEAAATAVNGTGVGILAEACAAAGARLIHLSTDYVFPGNATAPYAEQDPTEPVNAYGRSKLAGEQAVLAALPETGYVVRTAWLYGEHGPNFVSTMLRLAGQRETLEVVDDQLGQPTWSLALARRLVGLGEAAVGGRAPAGIYHGTASGRTTWFGLARAAFELAGLDPRRIRPTTSDKFPRPATRPAYSVLGHGAWARIGMEPLPHWRSSLAEAFEAEAVAAPAGTTGSISPGSGHSD